MQGFEDGDAIYRKLILFLKDEVLDRGLRPCPQKQSRAGLDGEEVNQTLSASSVEIFVSSLMALWTHNLRHPHGRRT
jgi:hypothetical protein